MTRAVRDRILKDANSDIGDHLRNHIHLTNCIHLKNHMHKHSPMLHDRSLMRDLIVLQRSRSLRDPSASPPSWQSPLTTDVVAKSAEMVASVSRRKSRGVDHPRTERKLRSSPPQETKESAAASKSNAGEADTIAAGVTLTGEHSTTSGAREGRKGKTKQTVGTNDPLFANERSLHENLNELSREPALSNSEQKGRRSHDTGKQSLDAMPRSLSQQFNEVPGDNADEASSRMPLHEPHNQQERNSKQPEPSGRVSCSGLNRVRRRKFRKVKRSQASARDVRTVKEASVASNSSVRALGHRTYQMEEQQDEYGENNVTRAPRNGCGIPWNWSRLHHRGKSFLDLAGRSFSCGLSDSRLKRGGSMSLGRNVTDLPKGSEGSSSCSRSDAEALPLLVDESLSQEISENAAWDHDYSGELGIFADSLLKHNTESDLGSDARSGGQHNLRGHLRGIHKSLTQKYMPRTFRDLVGQNLVVQALSNAVTQRRVGLLYVFYGPHGTGKTSCARILARTLNCQSLEHPKPCGFCSSCIAHDLGKSTCIKEVGPVGNFDFESIMDMLDRMMLSQQGPSHYRVFIFDDCDTLSAECWSAISKVIDRAPRRVVFMLICSTLDILPHIIISRCQKFFFPKLKDADIIYALQYIATKEGLKIDKDALKLIASRSDGSLRDAEMTLEQLSLLGQIISVSLVQELVGLISDEKLVDLLDLALSADTVNTVKNLREIMETGVEPLALMSQLATVITDILAGSYDLAKERCRRRFFKRPVLAKEDMEKLRHALRTLSEAEKQLRMSNDKLTWLTAALLQLAPDGQYMLPSSSTETSFNHSPLVLNGKSGRELARMSNVGHSIKSHRKGLDSRMGRVHAGSSGDAHRFTKISTSSVDRRKHGGSRITSQQISGVNTDVERGHGRHSFGKSHTEIDDIWTDVLDKIQISCIKEFLCKEGKLMSVSYSAAPIAQLVFSSHQTKSKAEKFKAYIVQAFESIFGCPVLIEMKSQSRKSTAPGSGQPAILRSSEGRSSQINIDNGLKFGSSEIVEVASTPKREASMRTPEVAGALEKPSDRACPSELTRSQEQNQCRSLVRGKVSLAHVIQQTEGNHSWTKRKAVSIAEKLEQDNLRLESKTRSLLCWKSSRRARRKFWHLKRRGASFQRFVWCGRCMSSRSPRGTR